MRKIVILLLLIFSKNIFAIKEEMTDPGLTLLSAYSCESVGEKSKTQLDNISSSFKKVISQLSNDDKCSSIQNQLSDLPNINSIIKGLESSIAEKGIQNSEAIITQGTSDLALYQQMDQRVLAGVMSREDRINYPQTVVIQDSIQEARSDLFRYRASLAFDKEVAKKESFLNGIRELHELGDTMTDIVASAPPECLNNGALKKQLTSGVLGISGFFLKYPLGVATNLAGKLLQKSFLFLEEREKAKRVSKSTKGIKDLTLISGLSCALESLARQKCRLHREEKLFLRLASGNPEKEFEGITDNECLKLAIQLPDLSNQGIAAITNWVNKSNNLGAGSLSSSNIQKRESAVNDFSTLVFNYKSYLAEIHEQSKSLPTEGAKSKARTNDIFALLSGADTKLYKSNLIVSNSTSSKEKNNLFLKVIFPEETSPEVLEELSSELLKEVRLQIGPDDSPYEKKNFDDLVSKGDKAMFDYLISIEPDFNENIRGEFADLGIVYRNIYEKLDDPNTPKVVKDIIRLISAPDALVNIEKNLNTINQNMKASLTVDNVNAPEELQRLVMDFYGTPGDTSTPFEQLKQLKVYFENLPDLGRAGTLYDVDTLLDKVTKMVDFADDKLKLLDSGDTNVNWIELVNELDTFRGANKNLARSIANINSALVKNLSKQMKDEFQSLDIAQQKNYNEMLFMMNKKVVRGALDLSNNIDAQNIDYKTAIGLNREHINGFGIYFSNDIDSSLKASEKKDPLLFKKLCISLVVLPNLSNKQLKMCETVVYQSINGKVNMSFNSLVDQGPETKACSYLDYLNREKYLKNKEK
jgi:hypothetical protein